MPVVMCKCGRLFATDRELRVGMCARCYFVEYDPAFARARGFFAQAEPAPGVTAAAGACPGLPAPAKAGDSQAAPLDPPGGVTKQRRWESRNPEKTKEATKRRVQRYRERQKTGAGM
jgi:hypothetical protein